MKIFLRCSFTATVLSLLLFISTGRAQARDIGFEQWLNRFAQTAAEQGVSKEVYSTAFAGINEPDNDVLRKAAYQPEFTLETWEYLDGRINSRSLSKGQEMKRLHQQTLSSVENRLSVDLHILLAIWSMESGYGEVLTKRERLHYIPLALATLAFADPKRQKFAQTQLIAVLKMLQQGKVGKEQLIGSWAGAMGHTQFIPTSYLEYATDMDGNGRADIWNSIPDALATAANLLKRNGWNNRQMWGIEVTAPQNGAQYIDQSKSLKEWLSIGFKPASKASILSLEEKAVLKMPAKNAGPAFLMGSNYFVIKRYNNSDAYALAVALLADQLAGRPAPSRQWDRPINALSFDEKIELQQLLKRRNYYQGEADGYFGNASREALKAFQHDQQLEEDGQPTITILKKLKQS